jgi:hypothetical protein
VQSIPVLDFDIICGALPSVALQDAANNLEFEDDVLENAPTVGPHTVRLLLKNTPDFCLPVGTAAELLERTFSLKKSLSQKARLFLDTVNDIQRTGSVSSLARELRMEDFPDLLVEELSTYERYADDLSLLSSLLSRNTPYERLVGHEHETRNIEAFRATLSYLKDERHRRPHSNLFDAYNVACAVEIFNNPSSRGPDRRIPLFITDTQRLNSWSLSPWLRRNEFDTIPDLSHDKLFLVFFQGIIFRNNGVLSVAQDEASLLSRQLIEIAELVKDLLKSGRSIITSRNITDAEVQLGHLSEPKVLLLQHKFKRLTSSWNDILAPTFKAVEFDRVHHLNLSLRPHLTELISSTGSKKLEAVRAVLNDIDEFRHKHHSFWELLQEHARSQPYDLQNVNTYESLIDISLTTNDGSLLSETRRGFDRTQAIRKWGVDWRRAVSASAHIRLSPDAVMSTYFTEKGFVAIRWSHNIDIQKLLKLMLQALEKLDRPSRVVTVRCYGGAGILQVDTTLPSFFSALDQHWDVLGSTEYLEVEQSGAVVFFADKEPIEGEEKQLGIVLHPRLIDGKMLRILARAISDSSFVPLDERIVNVMTARLCDALEIQVPS